MHTQVKHHGLRRAGFALVYAYAESRTRAYVIRLRLSSPATALDQLANIVINRAETRWKG